MSVCLCVVMCLCVCMSERRKWQNITLYTTLSNSITESTYTLYLISMIVKLQRKYTYLFIWWLCKMWVLTAPQTKFREEITFLCNITPWVKFCVGGRVKWVSSHIQIFKNFYPLILKALMSLPTSTIFTTLYIKPYNTCFFIAFKKWFYRIGFETVLDWFIPPLFC